MVEPAASRVRKRAAHRVKESRIFGDFVMTPYRSIRYDGCPALRWGTSGSRLCVIPRKRFGCGICLLPSLCGNGLNFTIRNEGLIGRKQSPTENPLTAQ